MRRRIACAALALAASCAPAAPHGEWADVLDLTPVFLAGAAAADPGLAVGPHGEVALTWVTHADEGADLWLAVSADRGATFAPPVRVNPEPLLVASYSESPPLAAFMPDGRLLVLWVAHRALGLAGDDIAVRTSADGGARFGPVTLLNSDHGDASSTYHGFAALTLLPDGRAMAAWIDGRASRGAEEPDAGEIYASVSRDGGRSWSPDARVAGEVCACCRIALAAVPASAGPAAFALAYRGMHGNLRDPRLAFLAPEPLASVSDTLVSADHWYLPGCPSVGPAIAFDDSAGHYLWYTGESADSLPEHRKLTPAGVHLARFDARSGAPQARVALADSVLEASRPMLARLGADLLVGVVARPAGAQARRVLALRLQRANGELGPWRFLGSGVRAGVLASATPDTAYAAWVERDGETPRVRLARLARHAR